MGYIFLFLSKIAVIIKMIAVKNCGAIARGARNSVIINIIRAIGCILVSLIVCIASGFGKIDAIGVIIAVGAGISSGVSLFTWVLCANTVSLCTVEVFCMAGGVVLPLIVSPLIFHGETVSLIQWIGSALLFVAMCLLSNNRKKTNITPSQIALLTLCGVANMGCVLTKKLFTTFSKAEAEIFQLFTFVFVFLALFIIFLFIPKSKMYSTPKFNSKVSAYISVAIVMLYLTEYFATRSSSYLSSAVFYPLSYVISMPLTFLTDVVVYKEKISLNNILGIVIVTVSGILINI